MKKTVYLFTISKRTLDALNNQLIRYLADSVEIKGIFLEENKPCNIRKGVVIFANEETYSSAREMGFYFQECEIIVGRRVPDIKRLEKLAVVSLEEPIILVSFSKASAIDAFTTLVHLGYDDLNMSIFYPWMDVSNIPDIKTAVTFGEIDRVPKSITNVIDLGSRVFDSFTLIKLFNTLGFDENSLSDFSTYYMKSIAEYTRSICYKYDQLEKELFKLKRKYE